MPYSAKDWSDTYHHDCFDGVDRVVTALFKTLRKHFAEWIRQIELPTHSCKLPSGAFGSEQRVSQLQLYCNASAALWRPQKRHLADPQFSSHPIAQLVLDHDWQPASQDSFNFQADPELADIRVLQGNATSDRDFSGNVKPTATIIAS